jgi:hypothetical protein
MGLSLGLLIELQRAQRDLTRPPWKLDQVSYCEVGPDGCEETPDLAHICVSGTSSDGRRFMSICVLANNTQMIWTDTNNDGSLYGVICTISGEQLPAALLSFSHAIHSVNDDIRFFQRIANGVVK